MVQFYQSKTYCGYGIEIIYKNPKQAVCAHFKITLEMSVFGLIYWFLL